MKTVPFDKWQEQQVESEWYKNNSKNKNGVLWSQTRMRIEIRLRCFLVNWQFVIGDGQ